MPLDIQQFPKGLASMLNLKQGGATPRILADSIAGVIDVETLYLLNDRTQTAIFTGNPPAVGANFYTVQLDVPANEIWYVWGYCVVAVAGAGAAIDLAAGVRLDGNPIMEPLTEYAAAAANQEIRVNGRGFWAGPGSRFGFLVRSVTLVPTIQGIVTHTRLRV